MNSRQMKNRWLSVILGLTTLITFGFCNISAFAKDRVIEITWNDHDPKMSGPSQVSIIWAKEVEKRCKGRVKFNMHFGGVLLKNTEGYRGIQKGIADAGSYILNRKDGFLLNTVMTLPFMGWPNYAKTEKIYQALLNEFPEMRAEWKKVVPIAFPMMPPTQIHNSKKIIRTPDDLKGMKFHGAEHAAVQIMAETNATPVQMDISDMYMSLDRGLIDGVMNHFPVLSVFGVLKLLNYHSVFGEGGINMTPKIVIWNERSWKRLPADIQKIILNSGEFYSSAWYAMTDGMIIDAMENIKKWDHTVTHLTVAEKQEWYNLIKLPIHDKWIKIAEKNRLPGTEVYNAALRMIKKY